MQIYEIDDKTALDFLRAHKAGKEQISISSSDKWLMADDSGVIGIKYGKHKDRIKAFYVAPEKRESGAGTALLTEAMKQTKSNTITAFATVLSAGIFEKAGFRKSHTNKYNVSFMERRNDI